MSSEIYQRDSETRKLFFEQAVSESGISFEIIEKDYWVVWTLELLFSLPKIKENLTFKGGTSLSKVYRVIERFSEDIDVSIERSFLGYGDDKAPEKMPSKKKQNAMLNLISESCTKYVKGELIQELDQLIKSKLPNTEEWKLIVDPDDEQTLLFYYPAVTKTDGYIPQRVKIEIGARSEHWPVSVHPIQSYVKEILKEKVTEQKIEVRVLNAERTFWEKATILHQYAHLPAEKPLGIRLSRHYYDFYQLLNSSIKKSAIEQIDLLKKVAEHKKVYFASAWASYDTAKVGTLKLSPSARLVGELENDYKLMGPMFFGKVPDWKLILDAVATFEQEINSL